MTSNLEERLRMIGLAEALQNRGNVDPGNIGRTAMLRKAAEANRPWVAQEVEFSYRVAAAYLDARGISNDNRGRLAQQLASEIEARHGIVEFPPVIMSTSEENSGPYGPRAHKSPLRPEFKSRIDELAGTDVSNIFLAYMPHENAFFDLDGQRKLGAHLSNGFQGYLSPTSLKEVEYAIRLLGDRISTILIDRGMPQADVRKKAIEGIKRAYECAITLEDAGIRRKEVSIGVLKTKGEPDKELSAYLPIEDLIERTLPYMAPENVAHSLEQFKGLRRIILYRSAEGDYGEFEQIGSHLSSCGFDKVTLVCSQSEFEQEFIKAETHFREANLIHPYAASNVDTRESHHMRANCVVLMDYFSGPNQDVVNIDGDTASGARELMRGYGTSARWAHLFLHKVPTPADLNKPAELAGWVNHHGFSQNAAPLDANSRR